MKLRNRWAITHIGCCDVNCNSIERYRPFCKYCEHTGENVYSEVNHDNIIHMRDDGVYFCKRWRCIL